MADFKKQEVEERIRSVHLKEEEDLARILSQKYSFSYLNLETVVIDPDAIQLVPEIQAREAELAAIQQTGRKLKIAIRNPNLNAAKEVLENLKRQRFTLEIFMVSRHSLEKAWERYKEVRPREETEKGVVVLSSSNPSLSQSTSIKNLSQLKEVLAPLLVEEEERKTSGTLEVILKGAVILEASDIHIEPEEKKVRLRLRLDGVLQDIIFFGSRVYDLLLSRIKLLSEIKLNIQSQAQDGRFTIRTDEAAMEVRASTLPGPYGESIVLRILNPKTISIKLENLGLQKPVLELISRELKKPNGMILTTGPTGSGKTTTLYAFLKKINSPDINIVTIEDPIEYHLDGINQSQINKERGYDFSNGLRSILRQDPDVILVGEVRDLETAETAMHAALTGHLVFSTLHTNNAPGTIPRLIDLGVKPNIIAPAINVAMAQRLVRKLCASCKESSTLTEKEALLISQALSEMPESYAKPNIQTSPVWRAVGCSECNTTGYRGRIGIFEIFAIDDIIENLILESPSESSVRKAAKKQGMLTMQQDGILKIFEGVTSWEEIERVTGD